MDKFFFVKLNAAGKMMTKSQRLTIAGNRKENKLSATHGFAVCKYKLFMLYTA